MRRQLFFLVYCSAHASLKSPLTHSSSSSYFARIVKVQTWKPICDNGFACLCVYCQASSKKKNNATRTWCLFSESRVYICQHPARASIGIGYVSHCACISSASPPEWFAICVSCMYISACVYIYIYIYSSKRPHQAAPGWCECHYLWKAYWCTKNSAYYIYNNNKTAKLDQPPFPFDSIRAIVVAAQQHTLFGNWSWPIRRSTTCAYCCWVSRVARLAMAHTCRTWAVLTKKRKIVK